MTPELRAALGDYLCQWVESPQVMVGLEPLIDAAIAHHVGLALQLPQSSPGYRGYDTGYRVGAQDALLAAADDMTRWADGNETPIPASRFADWLRARADEGTAP